MSYLVDRTLLQHVVGIAHQAGDIVMAIYNRDDFDVRQKHDDSPLTEADTAAHSLIVEKLQQLTPEIPVLSEESATVAWQERAEWSRYWLVDPLDGTKEFIKRNGEFTVNIALIQEHQPVLGVVYAPALQITYSAVQGTGAYKKVAGQQAVAIQTTAHQTDTPWRVVGSRSHVSERIQDLLALLESHEMVPMGSSLKLCLVAEGAADLYPRLGPTSEWDTAAAQCVVEAAGGRVLTDQLQPLRYNTKESLLNPYFVVCYQVDAEWRDFFLKEG